MKLNGKLLVAAMALVLAACGAHKQQKQPLLERLHSTVAEGKTFFGHQDDPVYGHAWVGTIGRSDVLETTGKYPGVMGWDLGDLEWGNAENLDGVNFERMRREAIAHDARGGINTFSWHTDHPLTRLDSWQTGDSTAVSVLVNTPEGRDAYIRQLDYLADFFNSLTDANGDKIEVLFRPWHEHTGNWFWWGATECSVDDYKSLWRIMRERFDEKGVDNIVWVYSPDRCETVEQYMERYPGDEYVDVFGADVYHTNGEQGKEKYLEDANRTLSFAVAEAGKRGKIAAFTETGSESLPIDDWFTSVLMPIVKNHPIAFVEVWRNAHDKENHFYAPYPGHPSAAAFKEFSENPSIIFVEPSETDRKSGFARVADGKFYIGDQPYRFVGTNFWYGGILGSEGQGGNRERLHKELDLMKSIGIDNVRVLVGGDGHDDIPTHIKPVLQTSPGVYNDTLLRGLDYLMAELEKRDMKAVLFLNNAWEWSGGYGAYLEWAGEGLAPDPSEVSWPEFRNFSAKFVTNDSAKALALNHVRNIVSRTNTVTGQPYSQSPAIFSWQVANEPRAFTTDSTAKAAFREWILETARTIKGIDPNHMVSTGSEGLYGCEVDMDLWESIHSAPEIDYGILHLWPYNWLWINKENLTDSVHLAKIEAERYIRPHGEIMNRVGKPLVLEEFGYPRDGFVFTPGSPTKGRDEFYGFVFDLIADTDLIDGCNFWGWGGYGQPQHERWQEWDDYVGDPAQEPQGQNSVFAVDSSTLELIKNSSDRIRK